MYCIWYNDISNIKYSISYIVDCILYHIFYIVYHYITYYIFHRVHYIMHHLSHIMYHINIYNIYQNIIHGLVYGDASQLKRKILENPITRARMSLVWTFILIPPLQLSQDHSSSFQFSNYLAFFWLCKYFCWKIALFEAYRMFLCRIRQHTSGWCQTSPGALYIPLSVS